MSIVTRDSQPTHLLQDVPTTDTGRYEANLMEQLGKVAQVLAKDLLLFAVNLEKRRRLPAGFAPVNLIPGRVVHLRLP